MLDCDECQMILEKEYAGAAEPQEAEDAQLHLNECLDCRDYSEFIARSTAEVEIKVAPEEVEQIRKQVIRRIRRSILGPVLWLVLVLFGLCVSVAISLRSPGYWSVVLFFVFFMVISFSNLNDALLERKKKILELSVADDLLKRCREEMYKQRALSFLSALGYLAFGCLVAVLAIFASRPLFTLAFASTFFVLSLYNFFRAFNAPKPWEDK
jgi:hypothetical protein